MTPAESFRMALLHWLIVISIAVVLSAAGGCAFEVEHTAHGWRFSGGVVVLVLVVLGAFLGWLGGSSTGGPDDDAS